MDVADGTEFVGVAGRAVIDDGEIPFRLCRAMAVRPFLEMIGEFGVGDDINAIDAADGREVVEDVFDHRPAGDGQQRLGLRERERIQTRGITGGQNDDFHALESVPMFESIICAGRSHRQTDM